MLLTDALGRLDQIDLNDKDVVRITSSEQDEIQSLEDAGFVRQADRLRYKARNDAVVRAGFVKVEVEELPSLLLGPCEHKEENFNPRWTYEWGFAGKNKIYKQVLFPSRKFKVFARGSYVLGPIHAVNTEVPYGVALKVAALKESRAFNAFQVFAPEAAFVKPEAICPLLLGVVWRMEKWEVVESTSYLITKWG